MKALSSTYGEKEHIALFREMTGKIEIIKAEEPDEQKTKKIKRGVGMISGRSTSFERSLYIHASAVVLLSKAGEHDDYDIGKCHSPVSSILLRSDLHHLAGHGFQH
jgi:hypothetical protein